MARIFIYDDREFPDPDPEMTVDQVKATLWRTSTARSPTPR